MFSGLVEALGTVLSFEPRAGAGVELRIESELIAADARIGDSICVNGCCLTVVKLQTENSILHFEAGTETLSKINSAAMAQGSKVNLERSLRLGDRLGGHLVSGHVDGVGVVERRVDEADWSTIWFRVAKPLLRQMAPKGSVAVDGVSLTLVGVTDDLFSVALIPHTLAVTTLGGKRAGAAVNIETDLLAKYVERQLSGLRADQPST